MAKAKVAQMLKKTRLEGGYPCPLCQTAMAVTNSRPVEDGIRRRRGCPRCAHRLSTVEREEKSAIPMRLICPSCGTLHIDEGIFATQLHHTHACQKCGGVWRPAVVPTVGVQFLPGFKNGEP